MKTSGSFFSASIIFLVLVLANLLILTDARHVAPINHPKYIHTSAHCLQDRYLIELTAESYIDDILNKIATSKLGIKVHRTFSHKFFNGLSIEVYDYKDIPTLLDHSSVVSMSANRMIKRASPILERNRARAKEDPISTSFTPETIKLLMPHNVSQVNKVRQELNLTGHGIFIGILDSGIDYNLKALGGGFGKGFKVVAGYDLVGDKYNSSDPLSLIKPDNDPLDSCGRKSSVSDGHGTHVAGIIAGFDPENNFEGVAPGATLGMWRVFSCDGEGTTDQVLMDALIMAYEAGVHIINLSIGSPEPFSDPSLPLIKIVNQISAAGVSVVVAAGNEGRNGVYSVAFPSTALSALSVASAVNEFYKPPYQLNVTGIVGSIDAYSSAESTKEFINGSLAIASTTSTASAKDACTPSLVSKSVKGKIALVKRGTCSFTIKVENAKLAGAVGVIIYNNIDEELDSVSVDDPIPVVSISLQDGLKLLNIVKNGSSKAWVTATKTDGYIRDPKANTISTFSSMGPTAELNFKPNIAAVGQTILSTVPSYLGGYGIRDGTSMACPYIAGSLALYLQYHGVNQTEVQVVHDKFKNYALQLHVGNESSGLIESPIKQGAGLVQVYDAITQSVRVSPSQISLSDTSFLDYLKHDITIVNDGIYSVGYKTHSSISAAIVPYNRTGSVYSSLNRPSVNTEATSEVQFSLNEMYLNPGESQIVTVTITPPNTDPMDHIMYGGFIQFIPLNQTGLNITTSDRQNPMKPIHVPYFGVVGRQRDLPIFGNDIQSYYNEETGITQTGDQLSYKFNPSLGYLKTDSFVIVEFGLINPTKILKAELVRLPDLQVLGHVMAPSKNVPATPRDEKLAIEWNGYYFNDTIAASSTSSEGIDARYAIPSVNGSYFLQLSALKLFGDPEQKDDWDLWKSGIINIETKSLK